MSAAPELEGLLAAAGVPYEVDGDSGTLGVRRGSARVTIDAGSLGPLSVVSIVATLLEDVDAEQAHRNGLLVHLNELNTRLLIGTLCHIADREAVVLRHVLLGDGIDASGLLIAIDAVLDAADNLDDGLRTAIGTGRRAVGWRDRMFSRGRTPARQHASEPPGGSSPGAAHAAPAAGPDELDV